MGHLNIVRELIVAGAVVDAVREVGKVSIDFPISDHILFCEILKIMSSAVNKIFSTIVKI